MKTLSNLFNVYAVLVKVASFSVWVESCTFDAQQEEG